METDSTTLNLTDRETELLCYSSPELFISQVWAIDGTTGEKFKFCTPGWEWQVDLIRWWTENDKTVVLKARQLGITWLAGALALWYMLFRPGSRCLVVSINEAEAAKVVNRIWDMYWSLPIYLRKVEILKPTRGARPTTTIELEHSDGRVSTVIGLPSTPKAGHGETAALVILDEYSRQEYAAETRKAILPTISGGGRVMVISTANGVANLETGEGNQFCYTYMKAEELGFERRFLPWNIRSDRDESWYKANALPLRSNERAEQYPSNDVEAFILSGGIYFDEDAIAWYLDNATREPEYRARFYKNNTAREAKLVKEKHGTIRIFQEPVGDHSYAIGVDTSTGRGKDYSCAYVIDLENLRLVASIHGKLDADELSYQLHFLGKWYNKSKIAVEIGGGHGEAVLVGLRRGTDGRPAYPNLYRHTDVGRANLPESKSWGFPITTKTRPLVLGNLQRILREREIPYLDSDTIMELRTFVTKDKGTPSPRAQDGCNDDRVMSLALTCEIFRRFGNYPKYKAEKQRQKSSDFPPGSPDWEVGFKERYR